MTPWLVVLAAFGGVIIGWFFPPRGRERFIDPPAVIPFSKATLCLACDCLTESRNDHCIYCAADGASLLRLGQPIRGEKVSLR